jgi:Zn-dependent protease
MWLIDNAISRIPFLLALVPVLVLHELAHAYVAVWLGDDTPKRDGRLTLNPLKHLDIWGTLLILFAGFGWAKPVMVNPENLGEWRRIKFALVAIAGPLMNFILAYVFAFAALFTARIIGDGFLYDYFINVAFITLVLCVFNMLPIPPLDGSKVVGLFLPKNLYNRFIGGGLLMLPIILVMSFLGLFEHMVFRPALWIFHNIILPVILLFS